MSHQKALSLILNTPPANNECNDQENDASLNYDYATTVLPFPSNPSQHTPSIFNSHHDSLEPPAWKPPDAEEIEYTDTWNNTYNNQHHYLQPIAQDDSTIASNQTNNSFTNNISFNTSNALRPRGLSLCSYTDAPSVGSCPQPQQGHSQHRRHPSLPVSFFSSVLHQGSHQTLFSSQHSHQNQLQMNKQYLNAIQSTKQNTPYETHSHHNASQVKVDGAMAGLDGVLLDLYMVDRSVDSATAKMLATKEDNGVSNICENEKDEGVSRKKGDKQSASQKPRKTSLGTLNDIQCILELHKLDKIVDRFKQDLQMPEFFEEEAWESTVWKDLRKTDVEMEEYARKKKSKGSQETVNEGHGQGQKEVQYQFDLCNDDWKNEQELGGEGIYLTAESFPVDNNAYQFFDPHETEVLQANSYQSSRVSASINDDLHEVIDLLRTDVAVDGASRRHKELAMIRPLLETDRLMNKWKKRSEVRDMWVGDLRALYLTDLEVDGAKRKCVSNPQKVEVENNSASKEGKASNHSTKQQHALPPVDSTTHCTDQEVKDMLSQHIPQVPQQFCPTSPELMPTKATSQAASFSLLPPAPLESRRAIFSTQEKPSANMVPKVTIGPAPPATKRSIFSRQEKSSAASQCAFQRGIMMPGTTTIVMAQHEGGEMIDDIPVGKVVMR